MVIAQTHLLFQLETLHLVLVLEGSLLDLESLETLETPFDLGGQIFDVARALSEEASQSAVDETSEGTLKVGCIWAIFFRLVTLGDIWDGRTREAGAERSVLEGGVLGGGGGEIWPLVDWEAGRHLDGDDGGRRWRKERKKILEISVLPTASRDEKQSRRSFGLCHPRLIPPTNPILFVVLYSKTRGLVLRSLQAAVRVLSTTICFTRLFGRPAVISCLYSFHGL